MNSCEFTMAVTALANSIAAKLESPEEIVAVAFVFVLLGDIHEGTICEGDMHDPFSGAMSHYDPADCEHPFHAGDLPPLFSNHGYAFTAFLTDRFSLSEIIGKTVIIHVNPDDITTQPSGNAGEKLACRVIARCREGC